MFTIEPLDPHRGPEARLLIVDICWEIIVPEVVRGR